MAYTRVSTEYLETKLVKGLTRTSPATETKTLDAIMKALGAAKAPILVIDGGAASAHWRKLADPLIEALKIPFLITTLGKGIANEESPYYRGPYVGEGSPPNTVKAVAQSDCILWIGNYPSDFNT